MSKLMEFGTTEYTFTRDQCELAWREKKRHYENDHGRRNVLALIFDLDRSNSIDESEVEAWMKRISDYETAQDFFDSIKNNFLCYEKA